MSCADSFARDDLVKREFPIFIDNEHPQFECEGCKVSAFSPGPVDDQENLAYLIIHPIHFDSETNTLIPTAFDQVITRDLSTIRSDFAPPEEVELTRKKLVERGHSSGLSKERRIELVCLASAKSLRALTDTQGNRAIGIYDTGLDDAPHHASLMTTAVVLKSKAERIALRLKVFEIFRNELKSLNESFAPAT